MTTGYSANELSILADDQATLIPNDYAKSIIALAISMIVLDTIIVGLRVWTRAWYMRAHGAWGIDDTLIILGLVPYIGSCIFAILASYYGLGTYEKDMPNPELITIRGLEYFSYWQLCYSFAIGFVKSSIVVALLRLTPQRRYRVPLWIIIASAGSTSLGGLIALFTLCRPYTANWNPGTGVCAPREIIGSSAYMISVFAIVTDLFCSIVPWFLIRRLQLSPRVRYSILCVLGLGVLASIGSAMRIPYLSAYSANDNILYHYAPVVTWSLVESGLGLAAGSIPPLGKLFRSYREFSQNSETAHKRDVGANRTIGGTPFSTNGTHNDRLTLRRGRKSSVQQPSNKTWNRLDEENISQHAIVQEHSVEVSVELDSIQGSQMKRSMDM